MKAVALQQGCDEPNETKRFDRLARRLGNKKAPVVADRRSFVKQRRELRLLFTQRALGILVVTGRLRRLAV
jgi:hypothetical protein